MSTVDRPLLETLSPLVAGQRLDRATFHARYEAMPPGARAELIEGVVHMPSPEGLRHDACNLPGAAWLLHYERFTPGVGSHGHASWFLDERNEVQPDGALRILPEHAGQSRVEGAYLAGAPDLALEVAASSRAVDLGPKLDAYRRAGVREYVVALPDEGDVRWLVRREDRFEPLPIGADGLLRSEAFPGLWLDPVALVERDLAALFAALDRGLATPEHAAFVARLAAARAAR